MGKTFKRIVSAVADAVTGGIFSALKSITALLTGRISDAVHYALKSGMYFTLGEAGLLIEHQFEKLFESKYKEITNVNSMCYNLLGEQIPTDARQEFIMRAVTYDYSYADSLCQQLFQGGAAKFMRYIRWCNKEDIYHKLGYSVSAGIEFTNNVADTVVETKDFAPVLCLRAWTIPVLEENFPEYWPILEKVARRAFSDKKALKKLVEDIHKSESADDIDFAYVFWGVPLNRKERGPLRYIWEFFDWLVEKDPEIQVTGYNSKFNGADPQHYVDENLYAEYAGNYYVKIAESNSSKGITFIANEEADGNLLKVPFQWRFSWATLSKEMNLSGKVETKGGIEITSTKEEEVEIENHVTAPLAIGKVYRIEYSTETSGDSSYTVSSEIPEYVYLIYRENWYVGGFNLGGEQITITYLEDLPQYVSGWGVPSSEQIAEFVEQGIISGDPEEDFKKINKNNLNNTGTRINLYTLSCLEGTKQIEVGTSGDTAVYEDVPCYAEIPHWNESDSYRVFVSPDHAPVRISHPVNGGNYSLGIYTIAASGDGNNVETNDTYYTADLLNTIGTVSFIERIKLPPSNIITIKRQHANSNTLYDRIVIHGLFITNYCLEKFPVTSDAADCVNWEDNDEQGTCPLLVPFHYQVFRKLNALDRNEALQVMGNIIYNCWETQVIEIKWYARSWFSVFMTIAQIIGTIVLTIYGGPAGAGLYAVINAGISAVLELIINFIIKLVVGLVVKYVVARIITNITGNALAGELLGAIAGMYASYSVGFTFSGGLSINFSTTFQNLGMLTMAKSAVNVVSEGVNKYFALQQERLNQDYQQLTSEMDSFNKQLDEASEFNQEAMNYLREIDNHTAVDIMTAEMWKLLCNPQLRDEIMYLGANSSDMYDLEQRYVYSFAEDQLKLPDLTKYV